MMRIPVLASLLALGLAMPAYAEGDLATRETKLPDLVLGAADNDFAVSQANYDLVTGKSYKLKITAANDKEMRLEAPDFFRNIWVRQVVVEELEVDTNAITALGFDDKGTFTLEFVPVRTGTFPWAIKGFEERGMKGTFTVK